MSKTRFIKVAAIITIIAAGLGTGAFFLQRSYQYNYADIRSVAVNGDAKQQNALKPLSNTAPTLTQPTKTGVRFCFGPCANRATKTIF